MTNLECLNTSTWKKRRTCSLSLDSNRKGRFINAYAADRSCSPRPYSERILLEPCELTMRNAWFLLRALCVAFAVLSVAGQQAKSSSKSDKSKAETASGEKGQPKKDGVLSAEADAWDINKVVISEEETYVKYEVPADEGSNRSKEGSTTKASTTASGKNTTGDAKKKATSTPGSKDPEEGTEETAPYEDDPRHRERQHMEDFMAITERIYVIKRNYKMKRDERCESAQKLRQLSETSYEYLLRTRMYKDAAGLMSLKVFFKISKTGVHKDYNAVTYAHGINEPSVERKLMYISPDKTCAILVEDLQLGRKGCQLVQPESAIDNGIPVECNRVYEARCGKKSLIVYEPGCRTMPDVAPHEEL
ncbi:hypothetical protein HPB50_026652 [Hyalomma asiaticum]|uniref:Uncharacterized protein n=1 Tax=Hyalomma asiaticum TaxID=266040 RepID=A0ACB7RQI2_HYAAI|nr:hypothetical protein HPB50_026652 [Hyalomma asiaticum]